MASISKSGDNWKVSIRRKGVQLFQNFRDKSTAELWAAYKEDLIDEVNAFDPPMGELVTLGDAFDMKIKDLEKEGKDKKTIGDYTTVRNHMMKWIDKPVNFFDYQFFMDLLKKWESTKINRGGNLKDPCPHNMRYPSKPTLLRRFAATASVFSFLIQNGIEVENNAQKVTSFIRKLMKKGE